MRSHESPPLRLLRLVPAAVLAVLLAAAVSLTGAAAASAHAELVRITPANGSTVTTRPAEVVLQFSEVVSNSFATISVAGKSSQLSITDGKAQFDGNTVRQKLRSDLISGTYVVTYRIVSADGHPVSGQTTFTVNLPNTISPSSSTPPAASSAGASVTTQSASASAGIKDARPVNSSTGGSGSTTLWIITAVIAVIVLGFILQAVSRRGSSH